MADYLGRSGCCLAYEEKGECDMPCFECRCTKCDWYIREGGACSYPRFKKEKVGIDAFKIADITEKAVLLRAHPYKDKWFPKSQIVMKGEFVMIPRWLLEEKGWMDEDDWWELGGLSIKEFEKQRLSKIFHPDPHLRGEQRYG